MSRKLSKGLDIFSKLYFFFLAKFTFHATNRAGLHTSFKTPFYTTISHLLTGVSHSYSTHTSACCAFTSVQRTLVRSGAGVDPPRGLAEYEPTAQLPGLKKNTRILRVLGLNVEEFLLIDVLFLEC